MDLLLDAHRLRRQLLVEPVLGFGTCDVDGGPGVDGLAIVGDETATVIGMEMGDEDVLDVLRGDPGGTERLAQVPGVGAECAAAAGVDEDAPAVVLDEEADDGRMGVAVLREVGVGQAAADLALRLTVQVLGEDGDESVVQGGDQEASEPEPLEAGGLTG
ncbi:hypothetical protein ADL34_30825 [Streptomyces sp. NRRL WC-3605]|nr:MULTISPECIES: hypothetical protein [unclassified Streptomyces]KUL69223.1 hypothetical protein ADL33_31540 [Streptomyces sp. NRRL WC-3604]KUL69347.1 hypothetical protein ADL34_30825 [Streptomyces sp. NRRL WC-3605]